MKLSLSLRLRLTLWYTLAILGVLGVLFFSLNRFLTHRLSSEVDSSLRDYTNNVQQLSLATHPADTAGYLRVMRNLSETQVASGPYLARIFDTEGKAIASYPDLPQAFKFLPQPPIVEDPNGEEYLTVNVQGSGKLRVISRTLVDSGGGVVAVIQVVESLNRVNQAINKLQATLLIEAVIGLFLALAIGYFIAWRGLTPLNKVIGLARGVHQGNLSARLPMENRPTEIQELADTFNSMLERVEKGFDQEKRFSADISHELRTPLTALRTRIEVMLMDPDCPSGWRPQLERLEAETARLIRLTTNLLLLSQLGAEAPIDKRPVSMVPLVHEVFHEAQLMSPGVPIFISREEPVTVMGDYSLIKQVVLNLMDNALKYTPNNGRVDVAVWPEGRNAKLNVADTGVGIPKEAIPHVFEPFFKASNGLGKASLGAGLGLCISKEIVERHNGEIQLQSAEGKGTTVTLTLPAI